MEKGTSKIAQLGIAAVFALLLALVACCALKPAQQAYADETADSGTQPEAVEEKHITSANDFLALVALSRERDTSNWVVYLDNDITLGDSDMQMIVKDTVKHLSLGNSEHPFAGTFDGLNHTVTGLKYANNAFDPERDTGFFAETKGATIKNFLVKDADVWADFRGGIIVGKAVDTHIENVMVMESTLHVTCANNALNLITNAGLEGGLIAGELSGCTLYNCEVRGGRAVNSTTSGVQALGGEGLYMAALAGYVDNSTIEYSRVTPTRNEDGSVAQCTDVTNKYDVAVGALGGNNVYASGFVGRMGGGAKVIDCFSAASCYSYSASYVGVVAVTLAWSGGLAGRIDKADGNVIERSHFAGDLSSRQYNPVAVIPIIQNDVNLGGIAGRASVGDATITDCYFKPSVSLNGSSQGTAANKKIYALANDKTASGASFGPWDDDRYVSRELWESHAYDFSGGIARSTDNDAYVGAGHGNAWAMDYKLGIPVHGASVKATLDFPGAGTVDIKATKLGVDQATADPYNFAVSAILAGTAQGLAMGDTSVTFGQGTTQPSGLSADNGGYRFMGWFREPGVMVTSIDEDNAWFNGKTDSDAIEAGKQVEANTAHDATSTYTADNAEGNNGFAGNDLFIASYQAQVLFRDANGVVLTAETGVENTDTSNDWYRYATGITPAIPQVKPASESATFIGWTTKANTETGSNGGYVGISSTDLAALKNDGVFYPAGQTIVVTKPADFYPVYSDYASNVITVCEGNEQDSLDDASQRVGVARTKVVSVSTTASTEYTVQVLDASGKALSEDGALPDGYRFLGWYETKQVNGQDVEVRVSRDSSYTLPAGVDLTVPHTYTARFEYRVDYYGTTTRLQDCELNNPFVKKNADGTFSAISYASNWQQYKSAFVERKDAPLDSQDAFDSWHEGPGTVDHGKTCSAPEVTSSKLVTEPFAVHAHVAGDNTTYDIAITDDFPGAASLSNSSSPGLTSFAVAASVNSGYKFLFWDWERSDMGTDSTDVSTNNPWTTGIHHSNRTYLYTAHLVAQVNFYWKSGDVVNRPINGRRYQEKLLGGEDHVYTYPFSGKSIANWQHSGNPQPSNDEMAQKAPGYKFLGWITTAEVEKDSGVWNYIYDVNGDSFTTSDPVKAAPYLVTDDYVCTQPQDVYPVYAKYNVNYDTNLHRAGFTGTDTVNAPNWQITPALTETDGVSTASVEPDIATTVYKDGTEKYVLEKVELECPDGTIRHLYGSGDDGNTYAATIEAGGSYTFVAYYTPLAVVYHLNAADIDGKVAQRGDTLGSLDGGIPKPTFNVGDIDAADGNAFHAFVGWTADKPDGNAKYVIWSQATDMVDESTVVNAPMELFPVYRATTVVVNSNIDSVLDDPSNVRGLTRTASGDQVSLQVKAAADVQGNNSKTYDFVGWSRDYNAEDGSYTLMTSEKDYVLEGSEPFATGVTYTAVYKETPWKVRYRGADGDVLYEASVDQGGARAAAGFVHQVEVPAVDENGKPVYDADGNQKTTVKSVAYDSDAYVDVAQELATRDADHGGDYKEMFLEWHWLKADGTVETWDQFKNQPITGDMDLYPMTFYVVAHDTSNSAVMDAKNNVTSQLKWQLDPNASGKVTDVSDGAPIKACFADAFDGTQLTISVDRVRYERDTAGNLVANQEKVDGKNVSLYSAGSGAGSFALEDKLGTKTTGADNQGSGNAVFDFPATHTVTLVKQVTDSSAAGMTFRFKVTKEAADSQPAQTRDVSVTVSATPSAYVGGVAVYSGAAKISVPSGTYTVVEDDAWAWRYSSSLSVADSAPASSVTMRVSAATSENDATVTCVNARTHLKWLDGDARAKNVWSDGVVGKAE